MARAQPTSGVYGYSCQIGTVQARTGRGLQREEAITPRTRLPSPMFALAGAFSGMVGDGSAVRSDVITILLNSGTGHEARRPVTVDRQFGWLVVTLGEATRAFRFLSGVGGKSDEVLAR